MKTWTLGIIVLSLALAGCATKNQPVDPSSSESSPAWSGVPPAPNVTHGLLEPAVGRNATNRYFVEANAAIAVTIELNGTLVASEIVNGRKEWVLDLPFGHRDLNVTLDHPHLLRYDNMTLVREAQTSLRVDWCYLHPDYPGERRVFASDYLVDIDTRPSEPLYLAEGGTHRDFFSAHDQLYLFEQATGIDVDETYFASSNGFLIDRIDGEPNPPLFWNFAYNGESSNVGVSEVRLSDGDRVDFYLVDSAEAPVCT